MVATIGAFTIALGVIIFLLNVWKSKRDAPNLPAPGPDPWDARSLEWMIPSPAPEHNFDEVPIVEGEDEWWYRKYGYDENKRLVRIATIEDGKVRIYDASIGYQLASDKSYLSQ